MQINIAVDQVENTSFEREVLPTDVYEATIEKAYFLPQRTDSKTVMFQVVFNVLRGSGEPFKFSKRYILANRFGNAFYEKDGKKYDLPDFTSFKKLVFLTSSIDFVELQKTNYTNDLTINLWDNNSKTEQPTVVKCIPVMINKPITLLLQEVKENKQKKDQDTGLYSPTNDVNVINDVFDYAISKSGYKVTYKEVKENVAQPSYVAKWLEKNKGVVKNKFKEVAGFATPTNVNVQQTNMAIQPPESTDTLFD